jgi:hypothetical protein
MHLNPALIRALHTGDQQHSHETHLRLLLELLF